MTQKEVVDKITAWVQKVHAGDFKAAFNAEDTDHDGKLDSDEIMIILAKAGIGVFRPGRWLVCQAIITAMDSDNDHKISFDEFDKIAHVTPEPTPTPVVIPAT